MNASAKNEFIREQALRLGFAGVGISKAQRLEDEARQLEKWLSKSYHGKMGYMENHFEKRVDPSKLVPGARSVISLLFNYYTDKEQKEKESPRISKYAFGTDYHFIIKRKLKELLHVLQNKFGDIDGRCFVDSAPVMERAWAQKSGLGWLGKHTLLIHPQKGSYFFLAQLITDLELDPDTHIRDHCGTCTKCIEACPTDAISSEGYVLDSSKCISYLTIELREAIPESFKGKMENYMFGCDICQDVCPWNRFSSTHEEESFEPSEELLSMTRQDWIELTEDVFNRLFKDSAVKRTKFTGLKRNIEFICRDPEDMD